MSECVTLEMVRSYEDTQPSRLITDASRIFGPTLDNADNDMIDLNELYMTIVDITIVAVHSTSHSL